MAISWRPRQVKALRRNTAWRSSAPPVVIHDDVGRCRRVLFGAFAGLVIWRLFAGWLAFRPTAWPSMSASSVARPRMSVCYAILRRRARLIGDRRTPCNCSGRRLSVHAAFSFIPSRPGRRRWRLVGRPSPRCAVGACRWRSLMIVIRALSSSRRLPGDASRGRFCWLPLSPAFTLQPPKFLARHRAIPSQKLGGGSPLLACPAARGG